MATGEQPSAHRSTLMDALRQGAEAPAWVISLLLHVSFVLLLATLTVFLPSAFRERLELSPLNDVVEPDKLPDAYQFSNVPLPEIGAMGRADADLAASAASMPSPDSMLSTLENDVREIGTEAQLLFNTSFELNPRVEEEILAQGQSVVGTSGVEGAIDRITHEVLLSLEQRPTLVVWLFDESGSLDRQRKDVIDRFDRVYDQLGVFEAAENEAFAKHSSKPLLTAVASFGAKTTLLLKKPTADVAAIKKAVSGVGTDSSGVENVFSAVLQTAQQFKRFRSSAYGGRNIMVVVFTDEAGNDVGNLEPAVNFCRRLAIPVYVVGSPAPFGREFTYLKYVDPDPNFDQTPQWQTVHQGPESLMPERIKLHFNMADAFEDRIDSGFGPFALTRLCRETGGLFFSVHPNREQSGYVSRRRTGVGSSHLAKFFDPNQMRKYRPDYVSVEEYQQRLNANRAKKALVEASRLSWTSPMRRVETRFVKFDEGQLAQLLSQAQRQAAVLAPQVNRLYGILKAGEAERSQIEEPRWQAGFDLAMGRTLATKVRTDGYNAMLAAAKSMEFEKEDSDTWILVPADTVTVGSQLEKLSQEAHFYLNRVLNAHPNTPWAMFAEAELSRPLGWKWTEERTRINRPQMQVAGNGNAPSPQNDSPRTAPPRKPRRPPPAL